MDEFVLTSETVERAVRANNLLISQIVFMPVFSQILADGSPSVGTFSARTTSLRQLRGNPNFRTNTPVRG